MLGDISWRPAWLEIVRVVHFSHVNTPPVPNQFRHSKPAQDDRPRIGFGLHFLDPAEAVRTFQDLKAGDLRLLVESPVLYPAVWPFLETIKAVNPRDIPLSKYFVPDAKLSGIAIDIPAYAKAPGFKWDLTCLHQPKSKIKELHFRPTRPSSVAAARGLLRKFSKLDPSQADAVMDSLNREVALIQGPPGTGKTFTGIEFLRVLLANRVKPILMLGFTNHAVDHILRAAYEGVSTNIVRLGTRSNDKVIKKLTLGRLKGYKGALRALRGKMRALEKKMESTTLSVPTTTLSPDEFIDFIKASYPALADAVEVLPAHVPLV